MAKKKQSTELTEEVGQKIQPSMDSVALSVVRINNTYQLIKIPFNKRTLELGQPEVALTDTDRFEIQSQFDYQADLAFMMKEELDE